MRQASPAAFPNFRPTRSPVVFSTRHWSMPMAFSAALPLCNDSTATCTLRLHWQSRTWHWDRRPSACSLRVMTARAASTSNSSNSAKRRSLSMNRSRSSSLTADPRRAFRSCRRTTYCAATSRRSSYRAGSRCSAPAPPACSTCARRPSASATLVSRHTPISWRGCSTARSADSLPTLTGSNLCSSLSSHYSPRCCWGGWRRSARWA